MKISVTIEGRTPTLVAIEKGATCTLTLGKLHDIVTKGDDTTGLGQRIAFSHRAWYGQNLTGKDYLDFIKEDLLDEAKKAKAGE